MKTYKAGTKVLIKTTCFYVGYDGEQEFILPEDMTEDELNEYAYETALNLIEPEGWFEVVDED